MIVHTYSVYQEVFLEVVNLNLTSAEDNMMEVHPSRIIGHHLLSHTAWLQSADCPQKNFHASLSKVVATLSKTGDFLAAQVLQERVLEIMTTASKGSTTDEGGQIADAVQTLVDVYQKSSARTQTLFARLGLKIPSLFLVAPFLDQAISQNNQLLTSVALSQLYLDRPESRDIAGRTVFHFAAERNADASLEVLFRTGMDFDEQDVNRETPLHSAARRGHLRVVRILLGDCPTDVGSSLDNSRERTGSQVATEERAISKPADINVGPSHIAGRNAQQTAEVVGHQDVVTYLILKSADVNTVAAEHDGRTALQVAAENGHLEVVKVLVSKSADVNAVPANANGRTALQAAAEQGHLEVVNFLISKTGDVNAGPSQFRGRVALQAAAENGHLEVVKLLVANSAYVNAVPANGKGRTALQAAAEQGHLAVVKFLVSKLADVNLSADYVGGTALQFAAGGGQLEVVKFLVSKSAHVNAVGNWFGGRTALQAAADCGQLEVVKFLISASADVNAIPACVWGRTALQAAAECGHLEITEFLISNLADVNAVPADTCGTALVAAVVNGHFEVMKCLISNSADVNADPADSYSLTAFQAAVQYGNLEVVTAIYPV